MNKKYTVFVSSTFLDLKDERRKVIEYISSLNNIPIGMEYFPAADDEQFNVIKKLIDDCDYYVLIIGGRYGSVNEKTGLSYTEMEYNYAVEKGVPVLVFSHSDIDSLPTEKKDIDKDKLQKLENFRIATMKNRLARIWKSLDELIGGVVVSLAKATSEIKRPGWTRGSKEDINALIAENRELRLKVQELSKTAITYEQNNIDWDEEITLHFIEWHLIFTSATVTREFDKTYKLEDLFKSISLKLTSPISNVDLQDAFKSLNSGYYVPMEQVLEVRAKFLILDLVEISNEPMTIKKTGRKVYEEFTKLTIKGLFELKRMNN